MIGERIREFRKQKGLTLEQLADKCGFSRSYVNEIENGKRPGSIEALKAVGSALGVPIDRFFVGEGVAEDEVKLLEAYRALSSTDKTSVLRHAEALKKEHEMRRIMK